MSIPKNLRTLKTNFEEADGLGISLLLSDKDNPYEFGLNGAKNLAFQTYITGNLDKLLSTWTGRA